MKKFFNKIKTVFNKIAVGVKNALVNLKTAFANTKFALANTKAEGYIDTGIKIIIAVVIGGVILAGLYALFNTTIIPTLTSKITEMFSYSGS